MIFNGPRYRGFARSVILCGRACLPLLLVFGLLTGCASRRGTRSTDLTKEPAGVNYYVQGVQKARAGKTDEAIALLEKAVAVNPNLRMAQAMLGDAYRNRGDYQRAAVHYEAATKLDRYNFANHYGLGLSLQLLNRLEEAAVAYIRALELNPRDARTNMNLGLVFLALGKLDQSERYLRRATELDPKSAQAWLNLGVVLDMRGSTGEAESTYRRAMELDSTNVAILQNLAQNLIGQQKGAEAIAVMEQVIARSDSPATRKLYGDAFAAAKQWDHAIAQYDLALKSDPQSVQALNEKGFVMARMYVDGLELNDKQRQAALACWRSSLKINPNQPRISDAIRKWENPGLFGGG